MDWITVRKDDDKLYKSKEGDFKRLRIQYIEDMLLLLVQGKQTNLTVEESFVFNVSVRIFTRSIVIQRRIEDLQLGVESYQKKLNLIRPNSYRSDLKRKEAYIAYLNPRGFIYQNKGKQNRLMRIDELHKFSDGTLIDVRTTLDDRLKGIRMKSILTDLQVTPTKPGRMTKPYSSHRFIANCLNAGNLKMEVKAYENSLIYKERTKKLHDDKIKNRIFNVSDQVLLFNSRLKIFLGKLRSRWSGPFTISEIYPYETAKLIHPDGCNFKVNCHRLKHYHGGGPPPLEIPDVHTFPKDN
nr:reverse transcriptase domain-containing protein [Tanacetum cinerariifolium]